MSEITKEDLTTILKSVYKMAGADLSFDVGEKAFLKKIIAKVKMDMMMFV